MANRPKRLENGRFPKGTTGNPGGRPREAKGLREFRDMHSMQVMEWLLEFMLDETRQDSARVNAARELNDRMHGRAPQAQINMEVDGSEDFSALSVLLGEAKSALILRAEHNERAFATARVIEQEPELPEPIEMTQNAEASSVSLCQLSKPEPDEAPVIPKPAEAPKPRYAVIPGTKSARRVS